MTNETERKDVTPAPAAAPEAPQPSNDAAAPKAAVFEAVELEAARAEAAEHKDRLLRTLAEMENLRRRTEKEIKDARDYAVTGFARDLLSVTDTFERAFAALPAEVRAAEGPVKAFVDGIEMTSRELLRVMEKAGVKKIAAAGAKFDPNLHQAMFELPADGPSGMVVQVLQEGYAIGDRVLRPALVGVSKAAPKAEPQSPPAAGEGHTVDKTV